MPPSAQKTSEQSRNDESQPFIKPAAVNLNSSPVIGAVALDTADLSEPQLPTVPHPTSAEEQVNNDVPVVHFPNNRREVFQMIESIQSSSPANTPGKLGYDTPVHLRRLRASHGANDIPLTPTFAPTENEEGYIGSSPTPATRDPTPAMNPDGPALKAREVTMTDATDIPSSPPEIGSKSPSPQKHSKRSRSERRRSARARKAMRRRSAEAQSLSNSPAKLDPVAESTLEPFKPDSQAGSKNNDAAQVDERPPSRRLRSALSQSTDNDQNLAPTPSLGAPAKDIDTAPVAQSTRLRSGSKRRKSSKSANEDGQHPVPHGELLSTPPAPDDTLDSSSEDVETQIASQLEQDMELAMDMGVGGNAPEQASQEPTSPATSKKRKRQEDDVRPTTSKERRRSTRLSMKDAALADLEELDATQSQDVSGPSRDATSARSTSPTLRRSTRDSQRKNDDSTAVVTSPTVQTSQSTLESAQDQASSQPPAKRSRKSLRHEERSGTVAEEDSSQIKLTRSRSRKARSSRNGAEPQPQPSQGQESQTESAKNIDHPNHDVIPESNIDQERTAEPPVPLVSTEEATDSQMTGIEVSAPTDTEIRTNTVDEPQPNQTPAPTLEQITTAAAVQTEPITPTPEPDTSETGIVQSLKKVLGNMKLAVLGPRALREVDDLLFNIRVEAHDASRRDQPA